MNNFTLTHPEEATWLSERKARRARRRWANTRAAIRRFRIATAKAGRVGVR